MFVTSAGSGYGEPARLASTHVRRGDQCFARQRAGCPRGIANAGEDLFVTTDSDGSDRRIHDIGATVVNAVAGHRGWRPSRHRRRRAETCLLRIRWPDRRYDTTTGATVNASLVTGHNRRLASRDRRGSVRHRESDGTVERVHHGWGTRQPLGGHGADHPLRHHGFRSGISLSAPARSPARLPSIPPPVNSTSVTDDR